MSNPCRLDDTTQNKVAYAMGFEDGRADAIKECIEILNGIDKQVAELVKGIWEKEE